MPDQVKLIECPATPGRPQGQYPADLKADYLKALIRVGFKHIDAVSFVSPESRSHRGDSEDVLKELDPPDDVELIAIVVTREARAAIKHKRSTRSDSLFALRNFFCAEPEPIREEALEGWRRSRKGR